MASISLDKVHLIYPLRLNKGVTFKEFFLKNLMRKKIPLIKHVHALQGISLTIKDGERVGIIGRNGTGKSTLLRTIAGVYPAVEGSCRVAGSICSMFDLTIGLEPEATGYENIFYRLYLQGETPQDVGKKLGKIVDFCELGNFLHMPVRCYSSGMIMRLAFSILTSLEPEILLIDEVFAAGDLAFQKKAEKRMFELMDGSRIVVMVSHDLLLIEEFFPRAVWVDEGKVRLDGPAAEVISAYKNHVAVLSKAA